MADLQVVAVLKSKAGSAEVVGDALATLVAPTLAEAGCVSYELFESVVAPGTFITIETWKSQEDLDAHMQTPRIAAALGAAGEHLDGVPEIHPLRPVAS
jgi:quinol monooxygenase YgiN